MYEEVLRSIINKNLFRWLRTVRASLLVRADLTTRFLSNLRSRKRANLSTIRVSIASFLVFDCLYALVWQ